jgi:dTMP kinase
VIEGVDCSGKTTQAKRLAETLPDAVYMSEPTSGEHGARLLELMRQPVRNGFAECDCALLDRIDDINYRIAPALAAGKTVVMDRYYLSTVVVDIMEQNRESGVIEPDITFWLDVPLDLAVSRLEARGTKREAWERESYLEDVRFYYHWLHKFCSLNIRRIDASMSEDEIHEQIMSHINKSATPCGCQCGQCHLEK